MPPPANEISVPLTVSEWYLAGAALMAAISQIEAADRKSRSLLTADDKKALQMLQLVRDSLDMKVQAATSDLPLEHIKVILDKSLFTNQMLANALVRATAALSARR